MKHFFTLLFTLSILKIFAGGCPFINLGPDTVICNNTQVLLNAQTSGFTYLWSTGDTSASILAGPGVYYVNAADTVNNCFRADTIVISTFPAVNLGANTVICYSSHITLTANIDSATYLWSTGDTSRTITVGPGSYTVTVTDTIHGCVSSDSKLVSSFYPSFTLSEDTVICGGTVEVNAAGPFLTYLWSTTDTTPNILVGVGTYYITVTDTVATCSLVDSVRIGSAPLPDAQITYFVLANQVQFGNLSTNANSHSWNFGDDSTSTQFAPLHTYTDTGYYNVVYIASNNCGSDTAEVVIHAAALNTPPVATNDVDSTSQPNAIVVNPLTNDSDGEGHQLCIKAVYGSAQFVWDSSCANIPFVPDSSFFGNDTCYYVVCDNGVPSLCDTGMVVVITVMDTSLLPVADFGVDFSNITCYKFTTYNTSLRDTGTAIWLFSRSGWNDSMYLYGDTAYYLNFNMWGFYGRVCLYVSNQHGKDTLCRNYSYVCEGIDDKFSAKISIYPNPTNYALTINWEEEYQIVTNEVAAIEIFNPLGQKIKTVPQEGNNRVVSIDIRDLPEGIFIASVVDDKGGRKSIGQFVVQR